ncbi:MAG: YdeI/OmpD-associated family protein [Chitinophagaceae bacterium]
MIDFTTTLLQFAKQGEKTGWTYIQIPADLADELKPGTRAGFRVKGKFDEFKVSGVALIPMGDGSFIIPFNADMRKGTGKKKGAMVRVRLTEDKTGYVLNKELMECIADEPAAQAYFNTLTQGHRNYFSKWIDSAKTVETRAKRIAMAVTGLQKKMGYPEMIRSNQKKNQ